MNEKRYLWKHVKSQHGDCMKDKAENEAAQAIKEYFISEYSYGLAIAAISDGLNIVCE